MFFFTSLKNRKIETHLPPYSRGSFKDVCVCVGGGVLLKNLLLCQHVLSFKSNLIQLGE